MEPKNWKRRGNILEVQFEITAALNVDVESPEFEINGKAVFQVMLMISKSNEDKRKNSIFVSFYKQPDENLSYRIRLYCNEFGIKNKFFCNDGGTWHRIYETTVTTFQFNILVVMNVASPSNSIALLHEDEQLTDFELRGEGGSVRVHRSVLAASSPVLNRMLCGTWRETTEGLAEIPGTTKETLQHLKNFIYLHTLPKVGYEQLLLLASYYMMPELEQKCVDVLAQNLTAQNICDLMEFAVKNKLTKLMLAIFESMENNEVKASDIRKHVTKAIVATENDKESKVGDK